jgi:putative ubiquitin-RnfH superfamily antitoxin RatB of RatAB toxin-antitoxin module
MASEAPASIAITVVFSAAPRTVQEIELRVPNGCLAADALTLAALQWGVEAAQLRTLALGVWGKPVPAQRVLRAGDRLEIYRPLTVDPKVARRERFARQGAKSAGLFATRRAGSKAGY